MGISAFCFLDNLCKIYAATLFQDLLYVLLATIITHTGNVFYIKKIILNQTM